MNCHQLVLDMDGEGTISFSRQTLLHGVSRVDSESQAIWCIDTMPRHWVSCAWCSAVSSPSCIKYIKGLFHAWQSFEMLGTTVCHHNITLHHTWMIAKSTFKCFMFLNLIVLWQVACFISFDFYLKARDAPWNICHISSQVQLSHSDQHITSYNLANCCQVQTGWRI